MISTVCLNKFWTILPKISKFQRKAKKIVKSCYIKAKQCISHFNLTNYFKILISRLLDFHEMISIQNLLGRTDIRTPV